MDDDVIRASLDADAASIATRTHASLIRLCWSPVHAGEMPDVVDTTPSMPIYREDVQGRRERCPMPGSSSSPSGGGWNNRSWNIMRSCRPSCGAIPIGL